MNAARPVAATLQTCQCCGVVPIWGGIGRRVQIRHRLPIWGGYRACVADALLGIDGKLEEQNKILRELIATLKAQGAHSWAVQPKGDET